MGKVLFLESVAGVAGDMFAASFVDAGLVTADELTKLVQQLGLDGVTIEIESVIRATVKATHINIKWGDENWKQNFAHGHRHGHDEHEHADSHSHENTNLLLGDEAKTHWHTHYKDIDALVERSELDTATKELSRRIFRTLAEAEAGAHGIDIEKVAFHEVGTIDSILDIVMAAYCVAKTGATQIFATPIKPGRGLVTMQHGTHPVPPPASVRLLTGLQIAQTPAAITRENVELSTPTGIAIIKCLAPHFVGELPSGTVLNQGMGAGTMDLGSYPNVFRVSMIGTGDVSNELPYETDSVVEIVCNIDDDTGEHLAWMTEKLMEKGALDVWQTAATGKKGRVLVCLSVLAEERSWTEFADWILRNGTTLGVRYRKWDRLKLAREIEVRETANGPVRHKIGLTTGGEPLKEKAEYDDLVR
ncbi:MAG TPA: LarC family nickel insertion protein [Pyrinomonadaceae bacterium]|nr:LarC family nickel insertion protein [Pyrinomonadaceae bacterium]